MKGKNFYSGQIVCIKWCSKLHLSASSESRDVCIPIYSILHCIRDVLIDMVVHRRAEEVAENTITSAMRKMATLPMCNTIRG